MLACLCSPGEGVRITIYHNDLSTLPKVQIASVLTKMFSILATTKYRIRTIEVITLTSYTFIKYNFMFADHAIEFKCLYQRRHFFWLRNHCIKLWSWKPLIFFKYKLSIKSFIAWPPLSLAWIQTFLVKKWFHLELF